MAETAITQIKGLNCPNCGDALELVAGQVIVDCKSCGTLFRVEGLLGTPRFLVKNALDAARAQALVKEWLNRWGIPGSFKRGVKVESARQVYVPMWFTEGQVIGWRLGYTESTDSKGNKTRTYHEYKVNRRLRWSDPATGIGELSVTTINLEGLPLNHYSEAERPEGEYLEITEEEEASRREAKEGLLAAARSGYRLDYVTDEFLDVVDQDFFLVYYPFWQVTYSYKNLKFSATVDGARSQLRYARAPRATGFRIWPVVLGLALVDPLIMGLGVLITQLTEEGKVLIGAVIVLFIFNLWLAKTMKGGGEIVLNK
ncbi:MAG: hypothetical protein ABIM88_06775 [candidate division WOR-3 bacterium]